MAENPKQTITQRVTNELIEQIITGKLQPGERLRQNQIAEQFETSHVPVREAFLRLEALGLLVNRPRRGVCVSEIDPNSINEILEMRCALEGLALRGAIPKFSNHDLEKAQSLAKQCDEAKTYEQWERTNRAFHRATIAPCGDERKLRFIDELMLASARLIFKRGHASWRQHVDADHQSILKNITQNNPDMAVSVLQRHINRAR